MRLYVVRIGKRLQNSWGSLVYAVFRLAVPVFLDSTLDLSPRQNAPLPSFDMRELVYIKLVVFEDLKHR